MPRIDQLDTAVAVADDDALPVDQGGVLHQATRAQIVAGLQPAISLSPGQLLGRGSASTGGPEPILIGGSLRLQGNTLTAPASFAVPALPQGSQPAAADPVPFGQGGQNRAVPYAQFLAGLSGIAGIDGSALLARPSGASQARRLDDTLADSVAIEAFGALGDGVSDDSAALAAAIDSGQPVRLAAKTYVVNGQFVISRAGVTLLGVAGRSVLKRASQLGNGAWIAVQASGFRAEGVIFDANRAAVTQQSWGVLVTSLCTDAEFHRCAFRNAAGDALGSGLVLQASDPAIGRYVVQDCEFSGNTVHGLWVQACAGVQVSGCRAFDNGQYGLALDFNDAAFGQKLRLAQVRGNRCWGNQRGIAIGNFNATNSDPPVWGHADPDALLVVASGNICHDNAIYGIAASGLGLSIEGNICADNGSYANSGAGILANVSASRVCGNQISGAALYGIDCGGSIDSEICDNQVDGSGYGINCGGGSNLRVAGNRLRLCTLFAVCINNVETHGQGRNFGIASSNTAATDNVIAFAGAAGGVALRDGPQKVLVARNHFVTAASGDNCLWADTDSVIVEGNRLNFAARVICNPTLAGGRQQLRYPDIADVVMVTYAPSGVQAMLSSYQVISQGRIGFIRVTDGGTGYGAATVDIAGAGAGASAAAMLRDGVVIGIVVTGGGSGYGPIGTQFAVTISGDGSGATAIAHAGAPLAEERRLTVRCNCPVLFARAGSLPLQENPAGADLAVSANADVEWRAAYGMWRAALHG